ncbi:MAG: sigma-54 dependent transcriptional regulator [Myxococcota bacterium]|nr:sigma-54 dependent transcriptional regulator [Myxococcota bacterium]
MMARILVVDDERSMRDFLRICLAREGHQVVLADSPSAASECIANHPQFDVVITDLKMQNGSGLDVLTNVKERSPETQVVVITAYATPETAIAAMKQGAYDYITKPFKVDEIQVVIQRALEKRSLLRDNVELREALQGRFRLDRMVGKSPCMQQIFDMIKRVAPSKTSILVGGESGTGKELVARAIHHQSPRSEAPFVPVNCGAIPDSLIESELFGHVKGAFTGATSDREGVFAAANGGTIFLDEIGELSAPMQVKLLRVLQERKIKPVGGSREIEVDVRVVAATNRDLESEVERGAFRRDLFYRLNVIQIILPPLRARREDIPLLAEHFLRKQAASVGKPITGLTPEAMKALCDYDFPGNVRELENIIERAVILETSHLITRSSLPELTPRRKLPVAATELGVPPEGIDLERVLGEIERDLLLKALEQAGHVRKEAAKLLNISLRSLRYRMAKHGVDLPPEEDG